MIAAGMNAYGRRQTVSGDYCRYECMTVDKLNGEFLNNGGGGGGGGPKENV